MKIYTKKELMSLFSDMLKPLAKTELFGIKKNFQGGVLKRSFSNNDFWVMTYLLIFV